MLSTDRLRHVISDMPPDAPLIAVSRTSRQRIVFDADRIARNLGVKVGMRVAEAKTLVPNLICMPCEPAKDAQVLSDLAAWALRYAPQTSPALPDGIWIDAAGSIHLHDGERQMLDGMTARLERAGMHAQAAIADTPGAAHAAARFSGHRISVLSSDKTLSALADLPVAALRLPDEIILALKQLGFDWIGQLIDTPRPPLAQRLGAELQLRLDQARGDAFEPISPTLPSEMIGERLTFVEPLLTAECFQCTITTLVEKVTSSLERTGLGARKLGLCLERVDGSFQLISVSTAKPSRSAPHLARLFRDRVDRIDPGLGVDTARLTVFVAEPLAYSQSVTSLVGQQDGFGLPPLVDCLANRLGVERVYRLNPVETDIPERAVSLAAPLASAEIGWPPSLPRPTRLLAPPQRVDVIGSLPNQPPLAFVWRQAVRRVCRADGPERIAGEWWKADAELHSRRDYFAVEDEDGRRYWLFRQVTGREIEPGDIRWFLHGLF
jgi:protein ImuB